MAFTFRPSTQAESEIEKIKAEAGINTNSKALDYVLRNFRLMEKELRDAEKKIKKSERELSAIKNIIARKTETDRIYNELVVTLIPDNPPTGTGAAWHRR